MKTQLFSPIAESIGLRIDVYLAQAMQEMSRNQVQKLCDEGLVQINSVPVPKNYVLQSGDTIAVSFYTEPAFELIPEDISLDILYQDDDIAVVNKPKGMVVHPGHDNVSGTLANALAFHFPNQLSLLPGEERPGIVHRLDRDTSGALIIAKSDAAYYQLSKAVKAYTITRIYRGIVYGEVVDFSGVIDSPIGRDPSIRTRMTVVPQGGRHAITSYHVIEHYHGFTQVEFSLGTGRMHQIRVHMESIGHPLAGDTVYSPHKPIAELQGQCLHAYQLVFNHPITGEVLDIISPLPEYFTDFIEQIKATT